MISRDKQLAKRVRFLAIASLAIGSAGVTPAQDRHAGTEPTERAGQQREAAGERSASGQSGSARSAAAQSASGQVASQAITRVVAGAVNPDGDLRDLVARFYGPDRERFELAIRQAPNQRQTRASRDLAQSVARLQQAFEARYSQPLTLTDEAALGEGFARVEGSASASASVSTSGSGTASATASGSGSGSGARAAGGRIEGGAGGTSGGATSGANRGGGGSPDNASGTSGTGAGGGGASSAGPSSTTDAAAAAKPGQGNIATGQDRAGGTSGSAATGTREQIREQIAGGESAGAGTGASASASASAPGGRSANQSAATVSTAAIIPAAHGLPPVPVSLVREGGEWRINVPDTLTPERLQANLARHLAMAHQQREEWPQDAKQAKQVIAHHVLMAIMDVQVDAAARERAAPPRQ